jgi:hypothetical protein
MCERKKPARNSKPWRSAGSVMLPSPESVVP